jgi:hypothetical protein
MLVYQRVPTYEVGEPDSELQMSGFTDLRMAHDCSRALIEPVVKHS